MSATAKPRSVYLDFLKAFAILLVIAGHAIQYGSGQTCLASGSFFEHPLFRMIYSFHMPLFMLISGYLFHFSVRRTPWHRLILRKAQALLIPLFAWTLLQVLAMQVFGIATVTYDSVTVFLKDYLKTAFNALWFLWAVFGCSALTALFRRFVKDHWMAYAAVFVLSFFLKDTWNTHVYKYVYPYFVIGYMYSKYHAGKTPSAKALGLTVLLSGAGFVLLYLFFTRDAYIYTTQFYLFRADPVRQLAINLYRYAIGFAGSLFAISVLYWLFGRCPAGLQRSTAFIGRETLGIYIISGYVFEWILPRLTASLSGCSIPLMLLQSVCILLFSLGMTLLIKKIPVLNTLLLGIRPKPSR